MRLVDLAPVRVQVAETADDVVLVNAVVDILTRQLVPEVNSAHEFTDAELLDLASAATQKAINDARLFRISHPSGEPNGYQLARDALDEYR